MNGNAMPANAMGHHLKGSKKIERLLNTNTNEQQIFATKVIRKKNCFKLNFIWCNSKWNLPSKSHIYNFLQQ